MTDLRRARRLAISDAATNTDGFSLKMTGGSPYTTYEIEDLSDSSTVDSYTINSNVTCTCTGGTEFKFGPLGNLLAGSGTQITITGGGRTYTITFTTATGMIKCTES